MTISLAIDTATARTAVGIIEDGQVLFSQFHDGATDHGRAVADLVSKALQVAKPPQRSASWYRLCTNLCLSAPNSTYRYLLARCDCHCRKQLHSRH
jgi:hypothetical protein